MFCEKCYDLAIKTASPVRQTRSKVITEKTHSDRDAIMDHQTMKENAVFLLDLAPLTNSGTQHVFYTLLLASPVCIFVRF